MKIIHTADLHIDSKMETNLKGEKAKQRRRELAGVFEKIVSYAVENSVDAIIVAGDMFDTERVTAKTKSEIYEIIKKNSNIEFLFLSGNHDENNIFLSENNLSNFKVFGEKWTYYDYGNVTIAGVSPCSMSIYDSLKLDKDRFNIAVLHGYTVKYNSENDNEKVCVPLLAGKNIDYLALGHIHSYYDGVIDSRGIYCNPGCPAGRGFDECGEKGFVVVDTSSGRAETQFVPLDGRKLFEVECDITGADSWLEIEDRAMSILDKYDGKDLIKLVLTGKYKLNLVKREEHLAEKLGEKFFFAKVEDKSSLEINPEDYQFDTSLRGEFIRQVLGSDLSQDEKDKVILIGLSALDGEEIE